MRSAAAVQRLQADNLSSARKGQTERFQYPQEYQQKVPLPEIWTQKTCQNRSRTGKETKDPSQEIQQAVSGRDVPFRSDEVAST